MAPSAGGSSLFRMSCFFCSKGDAECRGHCEEECDRDRKCYVDQNEVKICAFDVMTYPDGTRLNSKIGRHGGGGGVGTAGELSPAPPISQRSTTGCLDAGSMQAPAEQLLRPRQLKPQSVSWAEGFLRRGQEIGNLITGAGKLRLTPKASSFQSTARTGRECQNGSSSSTRLSFEQQMLLARTGGRAFAPPA